MSSCHRVLKSIPLNTVESVRLGWQNIGDPAVLSMATLLNENESVTDIDLQNNAISDLGVVVFAETLKEQLYITKLDLQNNRIGDDGGVALGQALRNNSTLATLNLYGNHLREKAATSIAAGLKGNKSLTYLNLGKNMIDENAAQEFERSLLLNSNLSRLVLSRNMIGSKGCSSLLRGMMRNTSLKAIELAWNKIDSSGVADLHLVVKATPSIEVIDFDGNNIGEEYMQDVALALRFNRTIRKISLRGNRIQENTVRWITHALIWNHVVTQVDVQYHGIKRNDIHELEEALNGNRDPQSMKLKQMKNDRKIMVANDTKSAILEIFGKMNSSEGMSPQRPKPLQNQEEEKALEEAYIAVDKNGDGNLDPGSLREGFSAAGISLQNKTCELMLVTFDEDKSGTVEYHEFRNLYTFAKRIINNFMTNDVDGRGLISQGELNIIIDITGWPIDAAEFQNILNKLTPSRPGLYDMDEFIKFCIILGSNNNCKAKNWWEK